MIINIRNLMLNTKFNRMCSLASGRLLQRSWASTRRINYFVKPQVEKNISILQVHNRHYYASLILFAKKGKKHQVKVDVSKSADEEILKLEDVSTNMQTAVEKLNKDFQKTLTLRTSKGALDNIVVKTDEGKFPLNQLAQISAKSPHLLLVNVYSKHVKEASTAISNSGMNLNPKVEGNIIHVPLPKVTKEHRDTLAKTAKELCDKTKVDLRNVRSKYISKVRKHASTTSKDVVFQLEKQISQISENFSERADSMLKEKTKELLENT